MKKKQLYLHSVFQTWKIRAISSAGSEHLPYKQGVTGSNPVSPTKKPDTKCLAFFMPLLCSTIAISFIQNLKTPITWGLHRFLFRIEFDDITPITKVTPEKPLTGSLNGMLHSRPNPRPFTKKRPSKAGRVER